MLIAPCCKLLRFTPNLRSVRVKQFIPDKTHSISGPVARTHLFTRIREYFDRELLSTGNPQ